MTHTPLAGKQIDHNPYHFQGLQAEYILLMLTILASPADKKILQKIPDVEKTLQKNYVELTNSHILSWTLLRSLLPNHALRTTNG